MTKANRDRGVLTERKVANYLRAHGFPHAERAVKTGMRTIDRAVADPGDITGTPGLAWQVKALRPLVRAEAEVVRWSHQTEQQRAEARADLGVLVVRRDQRAEAEWFAYVPLADLYALTGHRWTIAAPWGDDRAAAVAVPVRLYLGDLVTLLRSCGYGTPLDAQPATGGAVKRPGTVDGIRPHRYPATAEDAENLRAVQLSAGTITRDEALKALGQPATGAAS